MLVSILIYIPGMFQRREEFVSCFYLCVRFISVLFCGKEDVWVMLLPRVSFPIFIYILGHFRIGEQCILICVCLFVYSSVSCFQLRMQKMLLQHMTLLDDRNALLFVHVYLFLHPFIVSSEGDMRVTLLPHMTVSDGRNALLFLCLLVS